MNRITEAHIFVWRATPAIQCALRLFDSFNSETTKINYQFLITSARGMGIKIKKNCCTLHVTLRTLLAKTRGYNLQHVLKKTYYFICHVKIGVQKFLRMCVKVQQSITNVEKYVSFSIGQVQIKQKDYDFWCAFSQYFGRLQSFSCTSI